jgi:hypothetical protein
MTQPNLTLTITAADGRELIYMLATLLDTLRADQTRTSTELPENVTNGPATQPGKRGRPRKSAELSDGPAGSGDTDGPVVGRGPGPVAGPGTNTPDPSGHSDANEGRSLGVGATDDGNQRGDGGPVEGGTALGHAVTETVGGHDATNAADPAVVSEAVTNLTPADAREKAIAILQDLYANKANVMPEITKLMVKYGVKMFKEVPDNRAHELLADAKLLASGSPTSNV